MSRRKMKPLLWQTTNRSVPCYFLGTMHLADTWDDLVSKTLLRTFDACDVVCVEFNIEQASTSQRKKAAAGLKRVISKDNIDDISERTKSIKRRIERSGKSTPKNMQLSGLDGLLLERATNSKKRIIALETFKEQMKSMKAADTTVEAMNPNDGQPINQIHSAFLNGNIELFEALSNSIWGPQAANWCDRHVRMTKRLLDNFRKMPEKSFFVAIGAIHLLSPANVLEMLDVGGIATERI